MQEILSVDVEYSSGRVRTYLERMDVLLTVVSTNDHHEQGHIPVTGCSFPSRKVEPELTTRQESRHELSILLRSDPGDPGHGNEEEGEVRYLTKGRRF